MAFENDRGIYYSEGDYDYYIEKRKRRSQEEATSKPNGKKEAGTKTRIKPKTNPRRMSYKDARELEQIEKKIITAESEVEKIENIFASLDYYEKYATKTNELKRQLKEAKEKAAKLYERWEELERIKNEII